MPKVRTQTYSKIQQRILGYAYKQNKIYEMPQVRSKVVAKESNKQGLKVYFNKTG